MASYYSKTPGNSEKKKVPFAIVEAYKTVRTNLSFVLSTQKNNIVSVSSPDMSDGKSTTSVNIAIAFSQLGKKTLLIDADLRRCSLHQKLKLENETGLSNVLVGLDTFENAVHHVNPDFDVLTAGQIPPNPSELLGSAPFAELLEKASKEYDYVMVDTPPINVVADAIIVSAHTAGIVLVVREKHSSSVEIEKGIEAARFANIKILGLVVNGVDGKSKKNYYY